MYANRNERRFLPWIIRKCRNALLETYEAYMKIDDSPPFSVILQQYRELSGAVVDTAKGAKEQKLVGPLALKGMLDGVYKII